MNSMHTAMCNRVHVNAYNRPLMNSCDWERHLYHLCVNSCDSDNVRLELIF